MLTAAFCLILVGIIYGSDKQVQDGQSETSAGVYFHFVTVFLFKGHIFYFLSDTQMFKSKWSHVVMFDILIKVLTNESTFIHVTSS